MPGLLRGMARTAVVAGTATAVAGGVSHRQQARWNQQESDQQPEEQSSAAPATPAAPQDAMVAELQQLSTLKDQGILTQEEFDAKKKQILGI